MPERRSYSSAVGSLAVITENELRVFLEHVRSDFPNMTISATFSDGNGIHHTDIAVLLAQTNRTEQRLERLIVNAYSIDQSDHPDTNGYFHIELGLNYKSAGHVDFSYCGDKFFKIRDYTQQYLASLPPWYSPIYRITGWWEFLIGTVLGLIFVVLLLRAAVGISLFFQPKDVVNRWLDTTARENAQLISMLALPLAWTVSHYVKRLARCIYPPLVLNIGSEKKRQDRLKELRKWTLTTAGSSFLGLVWLALK